MNTLIIIVGILLVGGLFSMCIYNIFICNSRPKIEPVKFERARWADYRTSDFKTGVPSLCMTMLSKQTQPSKTIYDILLENSENDMVDWDRSDVEKIKNFIARNSILHQMLLESLYEQRIKKFDAKGFTPQKIGTCIFYSPKIHDVSQICTDTLKFLDLSETIKVAARLYENQSRKADKDKPKIFARRNLKSQKA